MIKGSTEKTLFEVACEAAKPKPYLNLSKDEAQEIADVYFKGAIDMAIASLRNGYNFALKMNNQKLAILIEKDIETYLAIWAEREMKNGK